jgi:hypothetical protein
MQAVLRGKLADTFIQGAARFVMGDPGRGLAEMEVALKPHDIAHWTAVTYLPFLWKPESHMFLTPEVTKNFAEREGHSFIHNYRTQLDPSVYHSLLELAEETGRQITDLQPRDRIDIQSLIWVVGVHMNTVEKPLSKASI